LGLAREAVVLWEQPPGCSTMGEAVEKLQEVLGYRFSDPALLECAVTHASAAQGERSSNERLEFLGDAVLGLVISDHLFRRFPDWSEGQMTQTKSAVVSRRTTAKVGRALGLGGHLRVDDGLKRRGAYTIAMVSGVYEAIVGAIFCDGGPDAAGDFVIRTLGPEADRVAANRHTPDHKSVLQKETQAEGKGVPTYTITRSEGPEHKRRFQAVVRIASEETGTGWGPTKRDAEQSAACQALNTRYPNWSRRRRACSPGS
jgi:ribonuclease-3